MEAVGWRRLDELFARALEIPAHARRAFVDRECGGDARLRGELMSLLAHASDQAADRLERPIDPGTRRVVRALAGLGDDLVGRTLGRDRIVRVVASGGMGTVYLAHRDADPSRPVALKLLHEHAEPGEVVARFHAESEVLASLDHPGIARYLDSGETDDDRPYYVMEFIDGRAIHEYCDALALDVPARVALAAKVCDAVAHAHKNLVVHRDLKPANVLVDREGNPRLVDFGIAKLLHDHDPRTHAGQTRSTRVMTPEYCSPEQARGERITTASDVYSLGVILHELLTGSLPHRFESYSPEAVARALAEEAPRPGAVIAALDPQTADAVARRRSTTPARLRRALRGDLDNVVATALRVDPQRRYATVDRLAEDLRRHLRGETVSARPDSFAYRVTKLARRHRAMFAATLVGAVTCVLGAFGVLWQSRLAKEESHRARVITDLLVDVIGDSAPDPASGPVAQVILDRARQKIERRAALDPYSRAATLTAIGRIYARIGDFADANTVLDESLAARPDAPPLDPLRLRARATKVMILVHTGACDRAEPELRRLIADAHAAGNARVESDMLITLGETLRQLDRRAESVAPMEQALALRRSTPGFEPFEVANAVNALCAAHYSLRELDVCEALCHEAMRIQDEAESIDTGVYARSVQNLGTIAFRRNQLDQAAEFGGRALKMREELYPDGHPDIAESLRLCSMIAMVSGRWRDAADQARAEVDMLLRMTPGHWFIDDARSRLGECLARQGDRDEAEVLLRTAFDSLAARLGDHHEHVVDAAERLATCYETSGRTAEAAALRTRVSGTR